MVATGTYDPYLVTLRAPVPKPLLRTFVNHVTKDEAKAIAPSHAVLLRAQTG